MKRILEIFVFILICCKGSFAFASTIDFETRLYQVKSVDGLYNLKNINGEMIATFHDAAELNIDGRAAIVRDFRGATLYNIDGAKCTYEKMSWGSPYSLGIIVSQNNKYGLIDLKGRLILPVKYDNIEISYKSGYAKRDLIYDNKEFFRIMKDKYWGLFEITSESWILPLEYDGICSRPISGAETFAVERNGKYGLINKEFQAITPFKYDKIGLVDEDLYGRVYIWRDDKWGLLDVKTGNEVLPCIYDRIYLRESDEDLFCVDINGTRTYVDSKGKRRHIVANLKDTTKVALFHATAQINVPTGMRVTLPKCEEVHYYDKSKREHHYYKNSDCALWYNGGLTYDIDLRCNQITQAYNWRIYKGLGNLVSPYVIIKRDDDKFAVWDCVHKRLIGSWYNKIHDFSSYSECVCVAYENIRNTAPVLINVTKNKIKKLNFDVDHVRNFLCANPVEINDRFHYHTILDLQGNILVHSDHASFTVHEHGFITKNRYNMDPVTVYNEKGVVIGNRMFYDDISIECNFVFSHFARLSRDELTKELGDKKILRITSKKDRHVGFYTYDGNELSCVVPNKYLEGEAELQLCKYLNHMRQSDVDVNIPRVRIENNNTFAVIIANENYSEDDISNVLYAKKDGEVFKNYCKNTLAVPNENIKHIENATLNGIRRAINWLSDISKVHDDIKIIFYYAGHGIPDESNSTSYLLPSDGIGSDVRSAYSLNELYTQLGALPAKQITVFMDACFCGAKRDGNMLTSARSVVIKARPGVPSGNMVVFAAAQGNETAYQYNKKKHGMFTYFLLKKLQESKGDATLEELATYINEQVRKCSMSENGKLQTPTVQVSPDFHLSIKDITL